MTLTKADIIDSIAYKNGITRKKGIELVESIIDIMKGTLSSGEDILISGFGKFCIKEKNERRGRNPTTGEDLMLAPRKVVTFKCSAKFRDNVNAS